MNISGGVTATLHQFANDWMSITLDNGRTSVISPLRARLDADEIALVREHEADPTMRAGAGFFFDRYQLLEDGTFRQRITVNEWPARYRHGYTPVHEPCDADCCRDMS